MVYKQNFHILLPIDTFEDLRQLGHNLELTRSELAREAIDTLLKKHRRKGNISGEIAVPAC